MVVDRSVGAVQTQVSQGADCGSNPQDSIKLRKTSLIACGKTDTERLVDDSESRRQSHGIQDLNADECLRDAGIAISYVDVRACYHCRRRLFERSGVYPSIGTSAIDEQCICNPHYLVHLNNPINHIEKEHTLSWRAAYSNRSGVANLDVALVNCVQHK